MSVGELIEYAKDVLKESWDVLISIIPIIVNYVIIFSIVCGILGITFFFIVFRKRFKKLFKRDG